MDGAVSYDIYALHCSQVVQLPAPHTLRGGTYAVEGTTQAHLNVTYNYGPHFVRAFDDERGIRRLYGMRVSDSLPVLGRAMLCLKSDLTGNYWEATEGNARAALADLAILGALVLAVQPDAVWTGD